MRTIVLRARVVVFYFCGRKPGLFTAIYKSRIVFFRLSLAINIMSNHIQFRAVESSLESPKNNFAACANTHCGKFQYSTSPVQPAIINASVRRNFVDKSVRRNYRCSRKMARDTMAKP